MIIESYLKAILILQSPVSANHGHGLQVARLTVALRHWHISVSAFKFQDSGDRLAAAASIQALLDTAHGDSADCAAPRAGRGPGPGWDPSPA